VNQLENKELKSRENHSARLPNKNKIVEKQNVDFL